MAAEFAVTPVAVAVHRKGESPIFGESLTHIRIEDDAAGPYLVLSQPSREIGDDLKPGELAFDPAQFTAVYGAAMRLLKQQPKQV